MKYMKGLATFILCFILVPVIASGYYAFRADTTVSILGKPNGTVAQRDAGSTPVIGDTYYVIDGASSSDCTVGGGSTKVSCIYNGATWVADGGAGFTITLPVTHVENIKGCVTKTASQQARFNTHMDTEYPNPPYDGSAIKTGSDWDLDNAIWWDYPGCTTTTTVPGSTTTTTTTTTTSSSTTSTSSSTTSTSSSTTSTSSTTTTTSSTTTTTSTTSTTTTTNPISAFSDFGWASAFVADETGATDCGGGTCDDTETLSTQWTDVGTGGYDLTPGTAPTFDADGCGTGKAGIAFTTSGENFLENTTLTCGDANGRCTVIIIGKFIDTPAANEYFFAGEGGGARTELYGNTTPSLKYYAGGATQTHATSFTVAMHAILWDLDGLTDADCDGLDDPFDCCTGAGTGACSTSGTTPLCIDTNCETKDAGPDGISSGITIGGNQFGSGSWPDYTYCAIGLYTGDATNDANYCDLRTYVSNKWSVTLPDNSCP